MSTMIGVSIVPRSPTETAEPIVLADAKKHLRVTHDLDNDYITGLISAARGVAEDFTGKTIKETDFLLMMDRWPGGKETWWDGVREGTMDLIGGYRRWIDMPRPPLLSVTEVATYDEDDTKTVFAASQYYVDRSSPNKWSRIVLRRGAVWPPALRVANSISIAYTSGYNTAQLIPSSLLQAIKMCITQMYRVRGDFDSATEIMRQCGGASLLLQHRVISPGTSR